jgi:5-methylcytosine-specific restriction protein A
VNPGVEPGTADYETAAFPRWLIHEKLPLHPGGSMLDTIKKYAAHTKQTVRHAILKATEKRSSKWPAVAKAFLQSHPTCRACGGHDRLNVHHKEPFHLFPERELDLKNLITLCMGIGKHCHILLGHGDDFKTYNPHIEKDASVALDCYRRGDVGGVADLVTHAKKNRRAS